MKSLWLVTALLAGFIVNFPVTANDDFNSGMDYARGLKGKDLDTFKSFKPADNLPDYSSSPDATKYYGGVQSTGVDLTSPGSNTLNSTEWGKAVTDSISKQPKDMVTADSPFLDNGRNAENNAETVFDPKLCESKEFEKSVFTNYVCDRDLQVQQYCTRTATISGHYEDTTEIKQVVIQSQGIAFASSDSGYTGTWTSPVSGRVVAASATYSWNKHLAFSNPNWFMRVTTPFGLISMDDDTGSPALNSGAKLTEGAKMAFSIRNRNNKPTVDSIWKSSNMRYNFSITLRVEIPSKKWVPDVVWSENCPFDKAEGSLTGTECTEPGGDKTVTVDGKPYTVHQDCWAYRDSYLTQSESEGTCGAYIHNPACNVINQKCVDQGDGACLHANITYSCETKTKGEGQVCGDELFCTDGSCVLDNNGKNDMFAKAASELAAVAAAGKDVAELNSNDVKIFTGKGVSCKKFAAGFSNCCKDSGWGQDVGLASCSSDEKALGKAKEKRLTVYVGEYCSKKVLGVCLEKKRGYCEFDSKLAQIIQQQGRSWQLGIGFGSGSSPDCRGITPEELQKIDFSKVDFSAFYDDLNSGSDIPADNNQMEKMKERMKAMFDQGSSH
ncbi:type-F conjugative transfer system mating-pair stabilization protein TraN (plasmid) [Erwinia tracheiphila]|uniref:Type-F conjugative transfer system mating-pair stabilization protein TraN n=1 Tax=Erwinia tracheiphila TaxID=65700 RepID=A0A345D036_9GAMM|nr:type-F conjugative transfer system mating-pair stabilization protein TraN [Erwinia tracheiphila]AXF79053.1 type-F conjugative transfer system mating-pair stabilization protein TraN [Erwinia tracheiphila]UIA85937.1 type-F conjugative transfer system mating-pair stabilization protein TraN [Erwinia tracheiphila]UIA94461.1 type-F conjugative transfer system mating-pair stabilization protein TraN [Erwinia tracheiphila]